MLEQIQARLTKTETAAPGLPTTSQYAMLAKKTIKLLYAELKEKAPEVLADMPNEPLQNSRASLSKACKAGIKLKDKQIPLLARQGFGLLVAGSVWTEF